MGNTDSSSGVSKKDKFRGNQVSIADFTLPNENFVHIIGEGSFSRVTCMKMRSKENQYFAVKSMEKDKLLAHNEFSNFLNEMRLLSKLPHTHFVVNLYYAFGDKAKLYMCTNLMLGGSLNHALKKMIRKRRQQNLLTRFPAFCPEVVKHLAAQLVLALQFIHHFRIVHRDIKPDNLLLDHNGHLRLTDFNISVKINQEEEKEAQHNDGWGTMGFRAPEIYLRQGKGHVFACDWWSAGAVIFSLLTGELPYMKKNSNEKNKDLVGRMKNESFSRIKISAVDKECLGLCEPMLKFDPSERLGCQFGPQSEVAILTNQYFADVNWDAYESGSILKEKADLFGEKMVLEKVKKPPTPGFEEGSIVSSKCSSRRSYCQTRPRVRDLELDASIELEAYARNFDKTLDYKAVHAHIQTQFAGVNIVPHMFKKENSKESDGKAKGKTTKAKSGEEQFKKFYYDYEQRFQEYFLKKAQNSTYSQEHHTINEGFEYTMLQLVSSLKPSDLKTFILNSDESSLQQLCQEMKDFREDYLAENQRYLKCEFEAEELRRQCHDLRTSLKNSETSLKILSNRITEKAAPPDFDTASTIAKSREKTEPLISTARKTIPDDLPDFSPGSPDTTNSSARTLLKDVDLKIYEDLEKYRLKSDTESGSNDTDESEIEVLYDPNT